MASKKTPISKVVATQMKAAPASQAENPPQDNIDLMDDVPVEITIELGRSRQTIETALTFSEQALIELDKSVGDPVDVLVNGKLFARGEVVTVSENFGVRITEIIDTV